MSFIDECLKKYPPIYGGSINAFKSCVYGKCVASMSLKYGRPVSGNEVYNTDCGADAAEAVKAYANIVCKNPNNYRQLPLSINKLPCQEPGNSFYRENINK